MLFLRGRHQNTLLFTESLYEDLGFVAFRDYFGRFSILFLGVIYGIDITPKKRIENRLKRTRKATETKSSYRLLIYSLE